MHRLMFQYDKIVIISSPLYYYWHNDTGITKSQWTPKRLDEFEAMDIQIAFFKERGIKQVYDRMLKYYVMVIVWQYEMLIVSDVISASEQKKYRKMMSKKLRRILLKHMSWWKTEWKRDKKVFDIAFPYVMRFYWLLKK